MNTNEVLNKLIAEIERLYEIAREASYNGEIEGEMTAYDKILSFITSLRQEQPEVDLEKYLSAQLFFLGADLIRHKPYSFNRGMNVGMTKAYDDILKKINARKEE